MKSVCMKIIVLSALLVFFAREFSYASGTAGASGAIFLELGVGSRPLAMAEAFTAEINDINTLYYNPAGLGSLKYPTLSIHHQELILDSRIENITGAFKIGNGFMAISNTVFWVVPFEKIDINGNVVGNVTFVNGAFTIGYGYDFGFMYLGASVKYIYQQIDTLFLSSVGFDIGILKGMYLFSPFETVSKNFHLGLSVLNLGSPALNDPLPTSLRIGLSYKLTKWFGLNIDVSENLIDPTDIYDFIYGFDESFRLYLGAEFNVLDILYLRGGYSFNNGRTFSLGLGFNYVVSNVSFNVDASYADSGVFGPTYSFNLSFKLIPKVITVEDIQTAEEHYKGGIKAFVADDIDAALKEFKKAKDYNPYHKNIDNKIKDIEELKDLKKKNDKLEEEARKNPQNQEKKVE